MDIAAVLRGLQIALMALLWACLLTQRFSLHLFRGSEQASRLRRRAAALLWMALLLQLLRVLDLSWSLQSLLASERPWLNALQTHVGQVLLAQTVLLLGAWACFHWRPWHWSVWLLVLMVMAGMAFSGHVVSSAESPTLSIMSVLHVVLAQLWLGGVWAMLDAARQPVVLHGAWRERLALFSKWALPGMGLLLFSGVMLSRWSVATWPGLLATPYGWLLLTKLMLVASTLWCAWQLRQWLSKPMAKHLMAQAWLSSEAGLGLGVVLCASVLAVTVPAAHDTVVWPWAFRWAPALAWKQDPTPTTHALLWALAALLLAVLSWAVLRRSQQVMARGFLALGGLVSLGLALPATTIPAYPTTYMHSSARLDADSVMAGQALYRQFCTDCHGPHGLGDGPVAKLNKLPAANLTEPHVSWHTHGDMFWWLSHGRGAMPGFASVLSVDERWHLINYLIALSLGYESRTITDKPAPFNPWLPSIDFRFQMDKNNYMSLSEWRGLHPVHLIIVNQKSELQRVRDLLQNMQGFPAQLVVVVPEALWLQGLLKGPCEAIWVTDTQGVIAKAWSQYRRTLAAPDFQNEETDVARMEFLIDRYGFVRARWRSDEPRSGLSLKELQAAYDSLSAEGEIKSAAIHQHD